jgi:hypothetical protein
MEALALDDFVDDGPRQDGASSGRRGFTGTEGCETSPEPAGT